MFNDRRRTPTRRSYADCLAEIGQPAGEKSTSEEGKFRQILGNKNVHFLAFFILVYVGVEVTIGGGLLFSLSTRSQHTEVHLHYQGGLSHISSTSEEVAHRLVIFLLDSSVVSKFLSRSHIYSQVRQGSWWGAWRFSGSTKRQVNT